jgi:hypothetical protein
MDLKFEIYNGDTGDLRTNENYWIFKWLEPNCHVLFSVTQQGKAANCHFTSDKTGLRKLEQALNEWCEFCFWMFEWCEMIIGVIEQASISKLAEKCDFKHIASFGKQQIYIRRPQWAA